MCIRHAHFSCLLFVGSFGIVALGCMGPTQMPGEHLESPQAPTLPPSDPSPQGPTEVGDRSEEQAMPQAGTPQMPSAPAMPDPPGRADGSNDGSNEPGPPPGDRAEEEETPEPQEPSEPPAEEESADPEGDPCMGLDYLGQCNGDVSEYCDENNTLVRVDCGARGEPCGWVDDELGWYCGGDPNGGPGAEPAEPDEPGAEGPAAPLEPCGSTVESEVVDFANASRLEEGLNALECDAAMTSAARLHSQDMCDQGYFSHDSLDGRTPWQRMRSQGVNFGAAAENIARGQRNPASVHQAWMNSPGHRANILRRGLRRIGVGFVDCNGARYWTQVFAD